eukprot:gnl/TRDRNA2_/TRDRNA2_44668_c0_seq1.p1 gnl/TRDRNA2_/TRDRNA2_44668_c0~~gnl/TRDRNA2_/TRDRNA2_44668_c0_seq1.p1  ORF type:complete len:252 (+),score=36.21 gnl/TRDRNA2_/TRDRNA2_44668_c0_seq1:53-808(+)
MGQNQVKQSRPRRPERPKRRSPVSSNALLPKPPKTPRWLDELLADSSSAKSRPLALQSGLPPERLPRKFYVPSAVAAFAMQPASDRCGIFLDVDGVLHPVGAHGDDVFKRLPLLRQLAWDVDENMDCAGSCDMVLTSSWGLSEDELAALEQVVGGDLELTLLDFITEPEEPIDDLEDRREGILEWLEQHGTEARWGERWIVLDCLDGFSLALGEEHVVKTDPAVGLTLRKVEEAVQKLKELQDTCDLSSDD